MFQVISLTSKFIKINNLPVKQFSLERELIYNSTS